MTVDQLRSFLKHQGFSDDGIDEFFLAHFGKKGMKWGQRNKKQKAAIIGGSIVGSLALQQGIARAGKGAVGRYLNSKPYLATLTIGGTLAAGAIATAKFLDRHKNTLVSEIPHSN